LKFSPTNGGISPTNRGKHRFEQSKLSKTLIDNFVRKFILWGNEKRTTQHKAECFLAVLFAPINRLLSQHKLIISFLLGKINTHKKECAKRKQFVLLESMDSPHNVTEAPQSHFKSFVGGITIEDYFAELRQIENKLNLLLTYVMTYIILLS
jgi:hypothetical protein